LLSVCKFPSFLLVYQTEKAWQILVAALQEFRTSTCSVRHCGPCKLILLLSVCKFPSFLFVYQTEKAWPQILVAVLQDFETSVCSIVDHVSWFYCYLRASLLTFSLCTKLFWLKCLPSPSDPSCWVAHFPTAPCNKLLFLVQNSHFRLIPKNFMEFHWYSRKKAGIPRKSFSVCHSCFVLLTLNPILGTRDERSAGHFELSGCWTCFQPSSEKERKARDAWTSRLLPAVLWTMPR